MPLTTEEYETLILDLATSLTNTLHCLNKNSITYINAMKSLGNFHGISPQLFGKTGTPEWPMNKEYIKCEDMMPTIPEGKESVKVLVLSETRQTLFMIYKRDGKFYRDNNTSNKPSTAKAIAWQYQ